MDKNVTPTPWDLCAHLQSAEQDAACSCGYRGGIWGANGSLLVCEMRNCDLHEGHDMTPVGSRAEQLANAAYIVKCVNAHAGLVKALEDILEANEEFRKGLPDDWDGDPLQDACAVARAALASLSEGK